MTLYGVNGDSGLRPLDSRCATEQRLLPDSEAWTGVSTWCRFAEVAWEDDEKDEYVGRTNL
jgi:hypothetical protein